MKLHSPLHFIRNHRFFNDGWNMTLLAISLVLNSFVIFWSLTHISPSETLIPIRYTSIANFDVLGHWYELYYIMAVSSIILIVNTFLAVVSFKRSRMISIFLLLATVMVTALATAIVLAFMAINYGTS